MQIKKHLAESDVRMLISAQAEAKATIVDSFIAGGFNVKLEVAGNERVLMHARRRKEMRTFKTIDSAIKFCRSVGISGPVQVLA